ncbi:hypothetical protein F11_00045 [Rhodospirillum rubrum F11]|nr:hypothetical protein F11_00045 [Rhodospirillum rubrum F11]
MGICWALQGAGALRERQGPATAIGRQVGEKA